MKKQNWLEYVKAMSPIKESILPEVSLPPKKRRVNRDAPRKPRAKMQHPERDVETAIINYLNFHGAKVGKVKIKGVILPNGHYGFDKWNFVGHADLEVFYNGCMYCVEVKAPGKKIEKDSPQDKYRTLFHKPPDRIFIEASSVDDVRIIVENSIDKVII